MLLRFGVVTAGILLVCAAAGCRPTPPPHPSPPTQPPPSVPPVPAAALPASSAWSVPMSPTPRPFQAIELKHVHNVHRVTDKLISGSAPEGAEGLKEIAGLGVKTIITVDGMTPDAETARGLGMRYVHLPFGYDGVPADRAREIAKAIRDLPGPIYLHCHHGKHRSAAAVATACVLNGSISQDRAEEVLRTFGTGLNYKGLWQAAREARRMDDGEITSVKVVFSEKTPIPPLAQQMLKIDFHLDNLKAVQKAGWAAPKDHPDLDPPHEALQLEELLVEMGRTPEAEAEPADYHRLLQANIDATVKLKQLLQARPIDKDAATAAMKATTQSCVSCHQQFRD